MKTILIVEDDENIQSSLKESLELKGYHVILSKDIKTAKEKLKQPINLIILDIELPDGDGVDFCLEIRKDYSMPILFLTCRHLEEDIVRGLNAGGDDYMCKPFGLQELYARIHSLLRRIPVDNNIIRIADLVIDKNNYEVYKDNQLLDLGMVGYCLLVCLIEHHGMVVTRDFLLNLIEVQTKHFVEDNTLSVHMKRLRVKLGLYQGQAYIETLRGVGYRWVQ